MRFLEEIPIFLRELQLIDKSINSPFFSHILNSITPKNPLILGLKTTGFQTNNFSFTKLRTRYIMGPFEKMRFCRKFLASYSIQDCKPSNQKISIHSRYASSCIFCSLRIKLCKFRLICNLL